MMGFTVCTATIVVSISSEVVPMDHKLALLARETPLRFMVVGNLGVAGK